MQTIDQNRLTLVVGNSAAVASASAVVHVDSVHAMQQAAATADVERIILDRSASAEEFLHVLAKLAPQIAGDVMLIRDDGGAFLSATARGGDRVLYALSAPDVVFYLQTHGLISEDRFAWTA
jgi:hypothetical protein